MVSCVFMIKNNLLMKLVTKKSRGTWISANSEQFLLTHEVYFCIFMWRLFYKMMAIT